jgi:predicted TIM-barrel fold metal-dependent hydrolase
MPGAELIVDADGHVCEPADLWTTRLPTALRARGIRLHWNADTGYDEAYVEDRLITDRGLVGLGNAGGSFADLGRGTHYQDINRAGFDPKERLRVLDDEGIDISVLYPGLALSLGAIKDRALAVASCRVYNDWMAEYCSADPRRLVGLAALPLQDPVLTKLIGTDTIIWASDFPHSDAKYPGVVDELREHTQDMTPDARAKLFGLNALRLYGIERSRNHERAKTRN